MTDFWLGFMTCAVVIFTPSLLTAVWLLLVAHKLAQTREPNEQNTENVVDLNTRRKRSSGIRRTTCST